MKIPLAYCHHKSIYCYAGKTALITGASSGIGREFARQLAARGMHLILVARREEKILELALELSKKHDILAHPLPTDLSRSGASQHIFDRCQEHDLQVDLLINNAGFGFFGDFEDISTQRCEEMIQVNCTAMCEMALVFLPAMLKRGQGAIINTASIAAFQPTPWLSIYGATKAFVLSLSESLWALYRNRGIRVTALCPGMVDTGFVAATQSNMQDVRFLRKMLSVERVVREGLRAMERGRPSIVNGRFNSLLTFSTRLGSRGLVARISEYILRPPPDKI